MVVTVTFDVVTVEATSLWMTDIWAVEPNIATQRFELIGYVRIM